MQQVSHLKCLHIIYYCNLQLGLRETLMHLFLLFISIRFSKMRMQNSTKTSQYNTVTLKIVVLKMNPSLAVAMKTGDVRVLKTRSMSDPEVE